MSCRRLTRMEVVSISKVHVCSILHKMPSKVDMLSPVRATDRTLPPSNAGLVALIDTRSYIDIRFPDPT